MDHLRPRDGREQQTTTVELFFDLVYVFAVTQLSHLLIGELSWRGAAHTAFLLLVVWWAWIYTTWMVNWFDPASTAVSLVLLLVMLASLLMAAAVPGAFGATAPLFAGAYVALQVGRNLAGTLLLEREHPLRYVFERILAWSLASAPLWIGGAFLRRRPAALALVPALALELAAPLVGYRTPGRGSSRTDDYTIDGGHFAERCQAFVIIALGESIVVTGASAAGGGLTAEVGRRALGRVPRHRRRCGGSTSARSPSTRGATSRESDDPGRLARDAYTYLHLPIVAGVIVTAVGDELLIAHPARRSPRSGRDDARRAGAVPRRRDVLPPADDRDREREARPCDGGARCARAARPRTCRRSF